MSIWDTAGSERFDGVRVKEYRRKNGIFLVYDITDTVSFQKINDKWLEDIKEYAEDYTNIMLIGNKNDKETERRISTRDGLKFARKHNFSFFETSAASNENIQEMFILMAKEIINKKYYAKKELLRSQSTIRLENITLDEDDKNTCCSSFSNQMKNSYLKIKKIF